jgi:hypothetical protein
MIQPEGNIPGSTKASDTLNVSRICSGGFHLSGIHIDYVFHLIGKIENANAASFIRPSRTPETPLSLLEALRNKYASEHLPDSELRASQQIRWGSKIVEEVGFEKIRRQQAILKELRIILLDGLCVEGIIAGSGQPNDHDVALELDNIQATCRQVIELDISRNLLRSWPEVIQICSHFDSLMSLKAR